MKDKEYFAFQWHITEDCDQRCKHCYIFAENPNKQLLSMDYPNMEKVVRNIENFCITFQRTPFIYLTGGDPILHPDFWKLAKLLKSRNISFGILGNPFHLTDDVCRQLYECGCEKYQMSIDGMEKTHDWFRKTGSFRETLEKISMIRKSGMAAVIMTTVSSINMHEIPQVIDIVVKYRADVFAFARYVPTSREKSTGISPQEYRNFLEEVDQKFKHYEQDPSCHTLFDRKDHLWTLYKYETGELEIPKTEEGVIYSGCNCGNSHLTILPTGEVYACRRVADSCVGNALEDSFVSIWLNPMEQYREYSKFSKCSKCELLAWCRGCPAVAKGTYGSFYADDPQCWKEVLA